MLTMPYMDCARLLASVCGDDARASDEDEQAFFFGPMARARGLQFDSTNRGESIRILNADASAYATGRERNCFLALGVGCCSSSYLLHSNVQTQCTQMPKGQV